MPVITNQQTSDGYVNSCTLTWSPATEHVSTNIFNAGVFLQFILVDRDLHPGAFDFNSSEYNMPPGTWNWSSDRDFQGKKVAGVRARSSAAGTPAIVNLFA